MKANLRILAALSCAVLMASGIAHAQGQGGGGQRQGRGGQGRMMMGGRNGFMSLSSVVQRSDVQADLKVTDDQKTKLAELRPQRGQGGQGGNRGQGGQGGGGGQGGNRGQGGQGGQGGARGGFDAAAMAERRAEEKKKIADILSADQVKRLDEIVIQLQGDEAVNDPDVQKQINFTEDQKTKLKDLETKLQDATRSLTEKMRNQEIDRQAAMEAMQKNQKAMSDEIHKLLTSDQQAKLKELGGKKFEATEQPRRGGGGGR